MPDGIGELHVRLCYVDDSGDSKHGVILSAILVEDRAWNGVLAAWLDGRRAISEEFGVSKSKELHAVNLDKGRGNFLSEGMSANSFTSHQRDATGRIMLSHLSRAEGFRVVTLAISRRSKSVAYRDFLCWLDNWAAQEDETAMVFYDGHQGYSPDLLNVSQEEAGREWETALREAAPYRTAHRGLEISTRRIVEDVVMQDSRYSQLIQAADLIAYGAFHKHAQDHPEVWGKKIRPVPGAIRAYMKLRHRWLPESENGIIWLE